MKKLTEEEEALLPKKMPWGKYEGVGLCFINSGYFKWLLKQDWFVMDQRHALLCVAIEREMYERDLANDHFYEDKVQVDAVRPFE